MSPINISNNALNTSNGINNLLNGSGNAANNASSGPLSAKHSGNTYFLQQLGKNQFTNEAAKFSANQKSPREMQSPQNQLATGTQQGFKVPTKNLNGLAIGGNSGAGLFGQSQQQNSSSTGNLKKGNGLPNVGSGSPRGIDFRNTGLQSKNATNANGQVGYNYIGSARNMSPNSQYNK